MSKPKVRLRERDETIESLIEAGVINIHNACKGKTRYANVNDARHAAKAVAGHERRDMVHYKCAWCGSHHIAKRPHGADEDAA